MELFFNNNPYENLGIFIRIFNFLMASIISIVLFRFTSNKNCLLTKIGQYSLWIYLGHTYFLSGIRILIRYFL
jgi:fucose 4-O-acetylase-like acetyltransferase